MTTKTTLTFDTSAFALAHGKEPRGGSNWAFDFCKGNPRLGGRLVSGCVFFNGTFAQAKKAAATKAVELGADFVVVLS